MKALQVKIYLPVSMFLVIALSSIVFAQNRGAANRPKDAQNVSNEKRTALVIGNGVYADSPLKNPANDANDMAAALKNLGFEVLAFTNLDQNGMKKAVRDFGAKLRAKGGVGLFYYAGHGVQVKGRNYLIPVSATVNTEQEVEYESVEVGLVLAQMEAANNIMNIVILDACRNNPFARSFRSAERGLASIDAPSGTLLAYSTAPGSVASDGAGKNGLYTQELLKAIRTKDLSIEDVFKRVRVSVRGATNDKQTPWENSSLTGNFYFAGIDKSPQTTIRLSPATINSPPDSQNLASEETFWKAIENSSDAADFKDYLDRCRKGEFVCTYKATAELIIKRLDKLDDISGEYVGEYSCGQGLTGLTIDIEESNGKVKADFKFYPLVSNPKAQSGEFLYEGTYDANSKAMKLKGVRWIKQPANYFMVDLKGKFDLPTKSFIGEVLSPDCTFVRFKKR
ncbi:MAG: caspase family protein [Pyrinomonadaceae bacterium]|nr:caspase family protein [Pyrinomonadaceae bacterium]